VTRRFTGLFIQPMKQEFSPSKPVREVVWVPCSPAEAENWALVGTLESGHLIPITRRSSRQDVEDIHQGIFGLLGSVIGAVHSLQTIRQPEEGDKAA
jgi:hypothetical protein